MQRLNLLLALALLAFTPACFISRNRLNTPLDEAAVAQLVPGTSTADDVLDALGGPMDVVQLGRRSAWRYDYTQGKTSGFTLIVVTLVNNDIDADRVWVFFDEDDVLTHIGGTFEAEDAAYQMPWQD